jgi:Mg-chelatase subunit ChlD
MSFASRLYTIGLIILTGAAGAVGAEEPAKKPTVRPEVEVVFCLDTTGSMGGLINAAKQKIWAISNQIAAGTPTPRVKIGLVAFRDRGDAYITKVFDLTDDLDAIHGHLMGFQAQGGGDFPESVNQALHEAVTKITWSKDKKTLKMVFLVGDAPPHMDYADDVKYTDTCKLAVTNDIIINTVQCGAHPETKKYWLDICRLAEGSYVQIDAKGGPIVAIATPYDADLAKINAEISRTTLVFGSREAQLSGESKAKSNAALAPAAAADRAAFYARKGGGTSYDLLTNVQNGAVKLESLKKDELPPEMQKMTLEEQRAFLKNLEAQRKELSQKALELDKKRGTFLAKKQAESAENAKNQPRDSFDNQVLQILQTQAARNGTVRYNVEQRKK